MLPRWGWWWNDVELISPRFETVLIHFGGLLNCQRVIECVTALLGSWWRETLSCSSVTERFEISDVILLTVAWPVGCMCVPCGPDVTSPSGATGTVGWGSCDTMWLWVGSSSRPEPTVRNWLLSMTWMLVREVECGTMELSTTGCWLCILQRTTKPFWLPEMRKPPRIYRGIKMTRCNHCFPCCHQQQHPYEGKSQHRRL